MQFGGKINIFSLDAFSLRFKFLNRHRLPNFYIDGMIMYGSWSIGGNLATARTSLGGCGTQTAGLSFGGSVSSTEQNITEEYDGAAWSAGGNLNTSRSYLGGAGIQTAGLSFGGYIGTQSNVTEEYNKAA